ncbi:MAG: acyl--CoA ligase [Victivallaceae bacterium]|nr:acyl--CoA ligase [Victivallaceae bacterium]
MNITQLIRRQADGFAGEAVVDREFSASYQQLFSDVDAIKRQLLAIGLKRSMAVALLMPDSYRYIVVSLAVLELEIAIVPIPINTPKSEIEAGLQRVKVNYILFDQACYSRKNSYSLSIAGSGKAAFMIALISENITLCQLSEQDIPAFIRFSSGTTGQSKGVVLSHRAIIERTAAANKRLKITADDRVLWVLDMSFHFVVTILLFLRNRASIVIAGGSLPEKIADALQSRAITVIYATPFHYRMMTQMTLFETAMVTDVRLAISTAMKLPFNVAEAFSNKYGFALKQAYGIIEVGLPFINSSTATDKFDSVGTILPDYELKLVNQDQQGRGEIILKGPGMFDAYLEPFALAEDIMTDGWFNTGDIGQLDDDGFLFIVGRAKNMINFIGMKIFPDEVEQVLLTSPLIEEVKVFGKLHDSFGEIPVAEVVVKFSADNLNEREIVRELKVFCYKNLPDYCVPKEFKLVAEIGKTVSGKIIRS